MKRCYKCKLHKQLQDFSRHSKRKDGLRSDCKICASNSDKIYRELHRVRCSEKDRNKSKSIRGRFTKSKYTAKKRVIPWLLSLSEYQQLISKPCAYCNNELGHPVSYGCGLDRMDSDKGYDANNAVPCCFACNTIKSNLLSFEETKAVVALVLDMRKIKERAA